MKQGANQQDIDIDFKHGGTRSPNKAQTVTAILLSLILSSCIGATPLPKRTRTPAGTEVKNIDLSFIRSGQTTRAEVKEKLKLIDTGYEGDRFFLGRWSSSSWGGWAVLGGCSPEGGCAGGDVHGGRVWNSGNLLVEFDDAGIVKRSKVFKDSHAIRELTPVAEGTPLQMTAPLELAVNYWRKNQLSTAKITLSPRSFDFEEVGEQKEKHKFSLAAKDLLRVETPHTLQRQDPTYTSQRLRCARDLKKIGGPSGKDINLQVTLPQLVTLMTYVSHAAGQHEL
jgi:hypothetical protein